MEIRPYYFQITVLLGSSGLPNSWGDNSQDLWTQFQSQSQSHSETQTRPESQMYDGSQPSLFPSSQTDSEVEFEIVRTPNGSPTASICEGILNTSDLSESQMDAVLPMTNNLVENEDISASQMGIPFSSQIDEPMEVDSLPPGIVVQANSSLSPGSASSLSSTLFSSEDSLPGLSQNTQSFSPRRNPRRLVASHQSNNHNTTVYANHAVSPRTPPRYLLRTKRSSSAISVSKPSSKRQTTTKTLVMSASKVAAHSQSRSPGVRSTCPSPEKRPSSSPVIRVTHSRSQRRYKDSPNARPRRSLRRTKSGVALSLP